MPLDAESNLRSSLVDEITEQELGRLAGQVAAGVRLWEAGAFVHVRQLQPAPSNHGQVDAMVRSSDGLQVAVKRIPNWWVLCDHHAFMKKHPREDERPWQDLSLLTALNQRRYSYACSLHGIFRDSDWTYAVVSLARRDLFSWTEMQTHSPGPAREAEMRPLASQLCAAVAWLHNLDVAHRDLSLENVVVADEGCETQVKLIDFSMASLGQWQSGAGRHSGCSTAKMAYKAPELHCPCSYDAFLADDFALGVMLYAMAVANYPWTCTIDGQSDHFDLARRCGVAALLARRSASPGRPLPQVLSRQFLLLLAGLLAPAPRDRLCVGESRYEQEGRAAAPGAPWFEPASTGEESEAETLTLDKASSFFSAVGSTDVEPGSTGEGSEEEPMTLQKEASGNSAVIPTDA